MPESESVRNMFLEWLSGTVSPALLSELYFIIDETEKYCINRRIISQPFLSTTDISTLQNNIRVLNADRYFRMRFRRNMAKINSFFQLYIQFLKSNADKVKQAKDTDEETETDKEIIADETSETNDDSKTARYAHILEKYFSEDGYQPGRAIFRGRFRNYYFSEYGHEPEQTDEQLETLLCEIGTQHDGRVFPKAGGEQDALAKEIISEVNAAFNSGATAVYPSTVFERYRERLAGELHIYTEDALSSLILTNCGGRFLRKHNHLVIKGREANPTEDIRRILRESYSPMSVDDIHSIAWYIPPEKLKFLLAAESSFISVAAGTYYYAPNFPISESEKSILISAIGSHVDYAGYITDVELMDIIREKCPGLAINAAELTRCGVRDCLGYLLKGLFAFNGPIITRTGCEINRSEVFRRFAADHQRLTYDELKAFADEMDTAIYWDAIMSQMVRLSENEFIRKDELVPDVAAIDTYLDGVCLGEYIPLCGIDLFLSFPSIGYQWNRFLLESYLNSYSRKFRLVHTSFSKKETCGAMVRAESKITDYDALITVVLSEAGREFTQKTALDYLVENGYQAKRSYKGIENVLRMAGSKALQKQ